jgi:hypothetical protein
MANVEVEAKVVLRMSYLNKELREVREAIDGDSLLGWQWILMWGT